VIEKRESVLSLVVLNVGDLVQVVAPNDFGDWFRYDVKM